MLRKLLLCSAAAIGIVPLAGCNATQQNAVLAAFGNSLAQVSCTSTPAAAGGIATNIINIAAPTAQQAKDDATAAAATTIAAELCPAFKGLGNVVISATIAANTPTGTPTVTVPVATAPAAPASPTESMKRGAVMSSSAGEVTSTNPFVFVLPVPAS